jgi:hypothetical protein
VRCVNCGGDADEPVWAVYADEGFAKKNQAPFALHAECYEANRRVEVASWEPAGTPEEIADAEQRLAASDDASERPNIEAELDRLRGLELVTRTVLRYRKREAPDG